MANRRFESASKIFCENEVELAKRIYWAVIQSGDELNIADVSKLVDLKSKRACVEKDGKPRGLNSFVCKYDNLFDVSRRLEKGTRVLRPVVKIEFCKTFDSKQGCCDTSCPRLHVCRHFVKGKCTFGSKCKKPHHFETARTRQILKEHSLEGLPHAELKNFLCRNVQFALEDVVEMSSIPKQLEVCKYYNVAIGCSREEQCPFLHVCRFYAEEGTCKFGVKCIRRHDVKNRHAQTLLARYKMHEVDLWSYLRAKADDSNRVTQSMLCSESGDFTQPLSKPCSNQNNMKHGVSKPRARSFNSIAESIIKLNLATRLVRKYSEPLYTELAPKQEICEHVFKGTCQNTLQCMKLHRTLPFSWEHSLRGDVWQEVTKQENFKLEANFSDVSKTESIVLLGSNQQYVFKFNHWIALQMNNNSFFGGMCNATPMILQTRRLSTASSVTKSHTPEDCSFLTTWVWYYSQDCSTWQCYDSDDNGDSTMKKKTTVSSNSIESAFQRQGCRTFRFQKDGKDFIIDFDRMVQEDLHSKIVCDVRRRPTHAIDLCSQNTQKSRTASSEKSYFPRYWNSAFLGGVPSEDCELIDMDCNSDEYRNVFFDFARSMQHCTVQWIKAVQNPRLWMTYAMKREGLKQMKSSGVEEMYLYRRADSTNAEKICINGFGYDLFDPRSATELKETSCFAKEAVYANLGNTANQNGSYYIFLCRVLVTPGCTRTGEEKLSLLKMKEKSKFEDPPIFYGLDYDNVYPEFLIMFTL